MTLERLGHLSQIISGVILVVGVVLVVMELRQAKALAQAQLISDSFSIQIDRLVAQLGEDSAAVLAKACEGSEPLTYADATVLSTKYQIHNIIAFRSFLLNELYAFENSTWEEDVRVQYLYIFRSPHGRAWWEGMQGALQAIDTDLNDELSILRNALFEEYSAINGCTPDVEAIYELGVQ